MQDGDQICRECSATKREDSSVKDGICDTCRTKTVKGGKVAINAIRKTDIKQIGPHKTNMPPPQGKKVKHKISRHESGWV